MKILLLSGGSVDEEFAAGFLEKHRFDKIIAVDGGLEAAFRLGAAPLTDIVGDFDTVEPGILKLYREMANGPVIHRFNPEKDYTDTDIALKLAIHLIKSETGKADAKSEIWLLGATGTRADHMLANMQLLAQTRAAGVDGVIVDKNNKIRLLEGSYTLKREAQFGDFVSLIPVTQALKGVTLRGFKYPLEGHTTYWGESLCVSNELEAEEGYISIEEGLAFLIESRD